MLRRGSGPLVSGESQQPGVGGGGGEVMRGRTTGRLSLLLRRTNTRPTKRRKDGLTIQPKNQIGRYPTDQPKDKLWKLTNQPKDKLAGRQTNLKIYGGYSDRWRLYYSVPFLSSLHTWRHCIPDADNCVSHVRLARVVSLPRESHVGGVLNAFGAHGHPTSGTEYVRSYWKWLG